VNLIIFPIGKFLSKRISWKEMRKCPRALAGGVKVNSIDSAFSASEFQVEMIDEQSAKAAYEKVSCEAGASYSP